MRWNSQGVLQYNGQTVSGTHVFRKPDPISRARPADLFSGTTARDVYESRKIYTPIAYAGPDGSTYQTTVYDFVGGGISTPGAPVEPSSPIDMRVIDGKLRKAILDQNVDLATALAEFKQTSNLVTQAAGDIYRAYQSLRHGKGFADLFANLSKPRTRNGRAAARRWLEFQYGMRPLFNDIYGSAQALHKTISEGSHLFAKARVHESFNRPVTTSYGTASVQIDLRMKGVARYRISSSGLKQLSEVGITNPAKVIWEIIPYSFVVDWILPVGSFLEGLSALIGTDSLQVARSYQYSRRVTLPVTKLGGGYVVSYTGEFLESTLHSVRFALDGNLTVGTIRPKNGASIEHMLNALALLRQVKF